MNERAQIAPTDANKVLILSDTIMYGPFPSQEVAQSWLDKHENIRATCLLYTFRPMTEEATSERAHECGSRLVGIEEASTDRTKSGQRRSA